MIIQTGLDLLQGNVSSYFKKGERLGLLSHQVAVTQDFKSILEVFRESEVTALFGPEHGFSEAVQDMISVDDSLTRSPLCPEISSTSIPVFSLYGKSADSFTPSEDSLKLIDTMVCDFRDVGARYYTYVWTALIAAEKVLSSGRRFIVLDSPNPLGGRKIEGTPQEKGYESFVGWKSLPVMHSLTIGEILTMFIPERLKKNFEVVKIKNWERHMSFPDYSDSWIPPSPNMPSFTTAVVYPGMCLLEATGISEGRGTTRPFEVFGAPGLDTYSLKKQLDWLPGVYLREISFTPAFQKHSGELCKGLWVHVTDVEKFQPYHSGLSILAALKKVYPGFRWRDKPYEFVEDIPAIDLLTGTSGIRKAIDSEISPESVFYMCREINQDMLRKLEDARLYQ
ncbi:MAG: DUF1343 domain-containing protein [Deltaproteobacteria bacterium]|nr:DUF1343 domain-containing protein [Deltaproteobacteria bacterium]